MSACCDKYRSNHILATKAFNFINNYMKLFEITNKKMTVQKIIRAALKKVPGTNEDPTIYSDRNKEGRRYKITGARVVSKYIEDFKKLLKHDLETAGYVSSDVDVIQGRGEWGRGGIVVKVKDPEADYTVGEISDKDKKTLRHDIAELAKSKDYELSKVTFLRKAKSTRIEIRFADEQSPNRMKKISLRDKVPYPDELYDQLKAIVNKIVQTQPQGHWDTKAYMVEKNGYAMKTTFRKRKLGGIMYYTSLTTK